MAEKKKRQSISTWFRKFWSNKKMVRVFLMCSVLAALCVGVFILYLQRNRTTYKKLYLDRVTESSQVSADEIEKTLNRRENQLVTVSATIAALEDPHRYSICNTLDALNASNEFLSISFVMKRNSMRYESDGSVSKVKYDAYDRFFDDSYLGLSVFRDPDSTEDSELTYLYPVFKDGSEMGYIIAIGNAQQKFGSIFTTDTTSLYDTLIIDNDGTVIVEGNDNSVLKGLVGKEFYTEVLNILTGSEAETDSTAESMELSLYDNYIGSVTFKGGKYGNGNIIFVSTAGNQKWTLVTCLFDSSLKKAMRPITTESIAAIIALAALIIFISVLVGRYVGSEQKKIHELAYIDDLTKSPNLNAFREKARKLIDENRDTAYLITCFDILNFRYINEGYGHEKADLLLKAMADALSDSYSYNETYGRVSADRFVSLVVDDGRNSERVEFLSDKISKATKDLLLNYPIKIKTGVYYVSNRNEDISVMVDKADLARKSLSSDIRGTLNAEYVDKLMEETRKQERIESRMEYALNNEEFVPYLQPKWNMEKNEICGAEALVRWLDPEGTVVPPGDFIPLFERNGFIEKVDFYMLEKVCEYIRNMIDQGRAVYPVSVNQSRFLMHDPEYVSKVKGILIKYKIPKNLIELEITETVFTHDKDLMLEVMNHLKELNVEMSMDDFGSGYSSLNLLRDIPFDVLKIDRGFLDESTQNESGKWILRKIVEMADGLNLRVICEGVETDEQVSMLLDIGCIYAQGFKYSRPIPLKEYIEKYDIPLNNADK